MSRPSNCYFKNHFGLRLFLYIVTCLVILNLKWIWERLCSIEGVYYGICTIVVTLFIAYEKGLRSSVGKIIADVKDNEPLMPLLDEQPTTKDKLGREEYVRMLGRKIVSTFVANNKINKDSGSKEDMITDAEEVTGSAYAINIEEDYGYGKTSFLMMLRKWFEENHNGQYTWMEFKPWLCDNPTSLISEFFHQLAQETNIDVNLHKEIIDYDNALASQIIRYGTGMQLTEIFKSYESSLKSMHDSIRDGLSKSPHLIVVTIDDLDRLDKDEVMAVLKLIRDNADFPNIFYITATEHTYLYNVLSASGISDPDRYIEKFFNLHFYLPAHEVDFRSTFIEIFDSFAKIITKSDNKVKEYENLKNEPILKSCFSDIRDVKRFVNQLVMYLESLGNKDYNLYDAIMLILLQYKSPEIYKILRDNDDVLLQAKSSGTDSILELKDDPIAEIEQREFLHLINKDKQNEKFKDEEPIKHLAEKHSKTRPYRNQPLGESILNVLFGSNTAKDEFAIKRTNNFFLYFSGREHSKSITKAETTAIMSMNLDSYKAAVDRLFKQDRANAFLQEMEYVIGNATEKDILDVIRKIFYFQYKQYDYTPVDNRRSRSWYAIKVQSEDLFSILYLLMGDTTPRQYRRETKPCPDLAPIIKKEPIIYVVSLLSILDRAIAEFNYQREDIDSWTVIVLDRLFKENLKQEDIITADNLYLLEFFRDELFSYRSLWDEYFTAFLCSDINIIRLWLSHLIIDYGGRYEWNFSVKRVLFGSPYDHRGKALMNDLKSNYPGLSSALSQLELLLKHKDLEEMSAELKANPFVKEFAVKCE